MAGFDELSPAQQEAIKLLTQQIVDPTADRKTYEQIAKEVGVDRVTLWIWRTRDKSFMAARKELVDRYADEAVADAFAALKYQLIKKKNVRAAEVLLKSKGMLLDKHEIHMESDADENEENINQLKELRKKKAEPSNETLNE